MSPIEIHRTWPLPAGCVEARRKQLNAQRVAGALADRKRLKAEREAAPRQLAEQQQAQARERPTSRPPQQAADRDAEERGPKRIPLDRLDGRAHDEREREEGMEW